MATVTAQQLEGQRPFVADPSEMKDVRQEVPTSPVATPTHSRNGSSNGVVTQGPIVVLKVGSSSLSSPDGQHANLTTISRLVEAVIKLRKEGYRVILVTSGAVSIGCTRISARERPSELVTKQAVAAIGQCRLMRVYDDLFSLVGQPIAQVLLLRENLRKRHHYVNALNTFNELLRLGVIPIVNENDTVAIEELRFGDNDTLSALVAGLVEAQWLFLLTDVDALYTADPNKDPSARPIHVVQRIDDLKVNIGKPGSWGTGGMATKITAARYATVTGVRTVITRADAPENILRILKGERIGTMFEPLKDPIKGKKKWIAQGLVPAGSITVDENTVRSIQAKRSLFALGITGVHGDFSSGSSVSIKDGTGQEIGRGLVNFDSDEVAKIAGQSSSREYSETLGYSAPYEVIHRDNLVVLAVPPAAAAAPPATPTPALSNGTNGCCVHAVAAAAAAVTNGTPA